MCRETGSVRRIAGRREPRGDSAGGGDVAVVVLDNPPLNLFDEPLFAARFAWSFLDPEPGYYGTSTYYGDKEVFTLGAALMSTGSDVDAAELRRRVTSPAGTTEAAIKAFQAGGFEALVETALNAAATRSAELAEQLGK